MSKFENPFPDKPIKSITLLNGDCVWGVIAITCSMHEIPIRGVKEILLESKVFLLPKLKEAELPSVPLEAPHRKSVFVCRLPNGTVKTISLHNSHVIGIVRLGSMICQVALFFQLTVVPNMTGVGTSGSRPMKVSIWSTTRTSFGTGMRSGSLFPQGSTFYR